MTTEVKAAAKKPPVGIKPRHLHDTNRIKEIHAAMGRYIDEAKQIPVDWTKELLDLSKSTFNK